VTLTDQDRHIIAKARELFAPGRYGVDRLRERYGETDRTMAFASAFGEAQFLLAELVAIVERPCGEAEDTRRLAEIRALLAGFDWERDDRQYALEQIEMIAEGGQP
jgi:hypothetical protein